MKLIILILLTAGLASCTSTPAKPDSLDEAMSALTLRMLAE